MGVVGEICLEDVQQSTAVDVSCAHAHPGLLPSIFVESKTGTNADFFEGFAAQVVIVQTRGGIAGDVNVGPPIIIEVASERGKSVVVFGPGDMNLIRNIGEMPMPIILI